MDAYVDGAGNKSCNQKSIFNEITFNKMNTTENNNTYSQNTISNYAQGKHIASQKTQLKYKDRTIVLKDVVHGFIRFLGSRRQILCHHMDLAAKMSVLWKASSPGMWQSLLRFPSSHKSDIILLSVIIKSLVADNLKPS